LVLLVLLTVPATVLANDDLAVGQAEYEAKCAVCHGYFGHGDGPLSRHLTIRSTDLTQLAKNNGGVFPETEILMALDGRSEVQGHGPRDMPIYGEIYLAEGPEGATAKEKEPFVAARLRALVAFLETLQTKPKDPPADLGLGKAEYVAKCAVCHGVDGKGGGPFDKYLAVRSTDLTQLMKTNHGVFPATRIFMTLDGRSEIQAHGPRDMPVYGEVYLAESRNGATAKEREPYVMARLRALINYLEAIQN
jgi:mono/diheme cytochrome c family protein